MCCIKLGKCFGVEDIVRAQVLEEIADTKEDAVDLYTNESEAIISMRREA